MEINCFKVWCTHTFLIIAISMRGTSQTQISIFLPTFWFLGSIVSEILYAKFRTSRPVRSTGVPASILGLSTLQALHSFLCIFFRLHNTIRILTTSHFTVHICFSLGDRSISDHFALPSFVTLCGKDKWLACNIINNYLANKLTLSKKNSLKE